MILYGSLHIAAGISKIVRTNDNFEGVLFVVLGLLFTIYGIIYFFPTPFTPKVTILDTGVKFKNKVLAKSHYVAWPDVKAIEMGPYEIVFKLANNNFKFNYATHWDRSIEIKTAIRNQAAQHNIQVSGG